MKTLLETLETELQGVIDYLTSGDTDEEIVRAIINAWNGSILKSADVKSFMKESGVSIDLFKKMIGSLSEEDRSIAISMMGKIKEFQEYDPAQPITAYLSNYIKLITGREMSDAGIKSLINSTEKSGQISVGPAENAVAMFFSNTSKMGKGDINIGGKATEFKFGGGRVATTVCSKSVADVWDIISDELGIDYIDWPESGRGNENTYGINMSKFESRISLWFEQVKDINAFAEAAIKGVNGMFDNKTKLNGYEKAVENRLKSIKSTKNTGEVLIKLIGCLCIAAYKEVEQFDQMLIQSKDKKGDYTKSTIISKFGLNDLMNHNIVFTRPNTKDSFKGMVINVA